MKQMLTQSLAEKKAENIYCPPTIQSAAQVKTIIMINQKKHRTSKWSGSISVKT
jgi:hypothetical protein